jgi:hypothetical protein
VTDAGKSAGCCCEEGGFSTSVGIGMGIRSGFFSTLSPPLTTISARADLTASVKASKHTIRCLVFIVRSLLNFRLTRGLRNR